MPKVPIIQTITAPSTDVMMIIVRLSYNCYLFVGLGVFLILAVFGGRFGATIFGFEMAFIWSIEVQPLQYYPNRYFARAYLLRFYNS